MRQERSKIMLTICKKAEQKFLQSQIGTIASVQLETLKNGVWEGYSKNYTRVKLKDKNFSEGDIVNVRLIWAFEDYCEGAFMF